MLLSVWAGTWKLQLQEINAESGRATIAPINKSATITDVSPGHYRLDVAGGVFTADLTGDDTVVSTYVNGADPKGGSWRDEYVHLQMIDPGVILVAVGTVGYDSSGQNSIEWINGVGGIATRKTIPVTQVPWAGTYVTHSVGGISAEVHSFGGADSSADSGLDSTVEIAATGPGTYRAGDPGDPAHADVFALSGNKLLMNTTTPNGETSERTIGQVVKAPYGRLVHIGLDVEFNSSSTTFGSPGQVRSAYMEVGWTDPAVNIAPTLDPTGSPSFTPIDEDATNNGGTLVSDLLSSGGSTYIYDPNSGDHQGIALVGADTKHGKWQYSTDGSTWTDTGKVNAASALLLAPDAKLRFVPSANFNGTLAKAISFRAWDQSSGTNGGRASVNASAGMTPFSKALDTASLLVNAVNDAPVLSGFATPLTYTLGKPAVSIFTGMKLADMDSKLLKSASIRFSGSLLAGEDQIAYRTVKGISGSFDAATNTLTLSGSATVAQYMAALKAVTFKVSAATSSAPTRTLTFTVVDDADMASISVDRMLQITA